MIANCSGLWYNTFDCCHLYPTLSRMEPTAEYGLGLYIVYIMFPRSPSLGLAQIHGVGHHKEWV